MNCLIWASLIVSKPITSSTFLLFSEGRFQNVNSCLDCPSVFFVLAKRMSLHRCCHAPFNFCASFSFIGIVEVIFKNTCPGPLYVSLGDLFSDRNPITEHVPWRTARTKAQCSGLSVSPEKNSWGPCRLLKGPSSSLWDIFEFPSTINSDSIHQLFLCTLTCRHDCASYCTICQDICNLYQGVTYGKYFIMLVSTL